jgi:2-polyprenyl-3-methyl-5-hydroxy-6-metoxy-1,4-benzoquinol methylase
MSWLQQTELDFYTLSDKPSQADLDEYYAQKYFQESKSKAYATSYNEQELRLFEQKLAQRFAAICGQQDTSSYNRFLDVGCGEGFALSFFVQHGYQVKGLDFSCAGMVQHHPQLLDKLVEGTVFKSLQEEIAGEQQYDIIWLEHVLQPIELLDQLKSLLSPGGVLVVTVPNDFSSLQQRALACLDMGRSVTVILTH